MLNISGVIFDSIVDGPGVRVTLFTQGCSHHCKGCHNPNTHDFKENCYFTEDKINNFIEDVKKDPLIDGLTISGGDPFDNDLEALSAFILRYKTEFPKHNIWIYTGYTIEELYSMFLSKKEAEHNWIFFLLYSTDVIVDGEYREDLKDLSLKFKGSQNQRIIHLKDGEIDYIED